MDLFTNVVVELSYTSLHSFIQLFCILSLIVLFRKRTSSWCHITTQMFSSSLHLLPTAYECNLTIDKVASLLHIANKSEMQKNKHHVSGKLSNNSGFRCQFCSQRHHRLKALNHHNRNCHISTPKPAVINIPWTYKGANNSRVFLYICGQYHLLIHFFSCLLRIM